MANSIYLKIKGTSQGDISKGCSTYDSIGNKYQNGHEDQIYVYSFDYDINREQNISHSPVIISKPIDKSSPLLGVAITNNEVLECELEFYRTGSHGHQEKYYTVKLTKASITNISAHYPNSLTHSDAQAYEDITIKYESISWNHLSAGTSGYSIRQNI
ncbi:TPA: Hcp family type VI secretion system effector [Morganella morganii]|uniref:Hcp family type VI secretion system effector n=1 Tax=Morganella morganii TaxID=582 RepID=UPI001BDA0889|nr:Hcp family type VI secretion system effector [Morganella morganii]MBT0382161.1 Hcp family type VI secretion system effector [Morganella morganii subsp. morganii]HDU8610126.1 Hcp family type VI secretion system effector [Morganella morganii]